MNRYVEVGLLADARSGKAVVVVPSSMADGRAAFDALAVEATDATRIERSNGRECVEFENGGSVRFVAPHSTGSLGLGLRPDVVFVEGWNTLAQRQRDELLATASKRGGELIRA